MKPMFHMLHYISIIQLVLKSSTLIIYCASCKWSIHMEPSFSTFLMLFPWYKLQENISYLREENAWNECECSILHHIGNTGSSGKICQDLKLRLWDLWLRGISATSHLQQGQTAALPSCSLEKKITLHAVKHFPDQEWHPSWGLCPGHVLLGPRVVCLQGSIWNALWAASCTKGKRPQWHSKCVTGWDNIHGRQEMHFFTPEHFRMKLLTAQRRFSFSILSCCSLTEKGKLSHTCSPSLPLLSHSALKQHFSLTKLSFGDAPNLPCPVRGKLSEKAKLQRKIVTCSNVCPGYLAP